MKHQQQYQYSTHFHHSCICQSIQFTFLMLAKLKVLPDRWYICLLVLLYPPPVMFLVGIFPWKVPLTFWVYSQQQLFVQVLVQQQRVCASVCASVCHLILGGMYL